MKYGRVYKIVDRAWYALSSRHLSDRLLKNLSLSFGSGLTAFVILFVVNILAARWLGPEEYGAYSVVIAAANIFAILFVMDIDVGITRFSARESKKEKQQRAVTTGITLVFILIALFLSVLGVFWDPIQELLSLTPLMGVLALVLGIVIAWKRIFESVVRALDMFQVYAFGRMIESLVILISFLIFVWGVLFVGYSTYVGAIILGGVVSVCIYVFYARSFFSLRSISNEYVGVLVRYARYGVINSLASLIVKHVDKVIIVGMIGVKELGIYSAYYTVSILISARLVQLFMNAYLPHASREKNFKKLFSTLRRWSFVAIGVIFIGFLVGIRVLLYSFGAEYPVYWDWIVLMALYAAVHFVVSVFAGSLSAHSREGYRMQNIGVFVGAVVFISVVFIGWFLDQFSVELLLWTLILYRIIPGIYYYQASKDGDFVHRGSNERE